MSVSATVAEDIFVDFGVRKPHMILSGKSDEVKCLGDLRELHLENCRLYVEDGFPRNELYGLMANNSIFSADGSLVKKLREAQAVPKSDRNDVFLIRQLAKERPDCFREMTKEEKQELDERMVYSYYCKLTSLISSLKNKQRSLSKEFGKGLPQVGLMLQELENEKKQVLRYFSKFNEKRKIVGIRGLGVRYLAGILIRANPHKFRSLSAYLRYCGYKGSVEETGRYSRHARSLYHQLCSEVIMHKDNEFYPLYLKLKADVKERFPDYPKGKIDGMARNRLSTFLAKRIYFYFRADVPSVD